MKGTDVDRATKDSGHPAHAEGRLDPAVALLTIKQVAERLNVSAGTVYALCAAGKLEHVRVGAGRGTLRVEVEALQRFIQGATVRSKEPTAPSPAPRRPEHPAITLKNLSLS